MDVVETLAGQTDNRSGTITVDLLVAPAAEEAGLTLLHFDRDFEAIARTSGQPVRMIELRR